MTRKPVEPPTNQTGPTEQKTKEVKQEQHLTVLHMHDPTQTQLPTRSEEALERHLREWGGAGGRLFAFNGQTGIFRTLDDDVEVPSGTQFIAHLADTQKGFIKFNDDGPPTSVMVRLDENAKVPERDELGDNDKSKWPIGMNGEPEDPWKPQFVIPMTLYDEGGEVYCYIARGIVAMNSAADLLGRWRFHPKRKAGLLPVIKVISSTYPSKKFGGRRPKPMLVIDSWVTPDGETPPEPKKLSYKDELNDEIGF
jgi:hypothetical protein